MEVNEEKNYKILVVDDNPKNVQVLGSLLKNVGYKVGFAMDGKQAFDLLQKSSDFDLILLDINMPVMDGYEACKAIRAEEHLKEIPIIFLTAFNEVENIVMGFELGAQDYVTKPFNTKELLMRVKTQLDLKQAKDTLKKSNEILDLRVKEKTLALEEAIEILKKQDAFKTNFLRYVSQQLREPLNGIVSSINIIKAQEQSSAIKHLLDILNMSVTQLEDFASQAMLYTELNLHNYSLKTTNINPAKLIQYALLDLNDSLQANDIIVQIDNINTNYQISADRDLLYKALIFIFKGLIKIIENNNIINISVKNEGNEVTCIFSTQGIKIPSELQAGTFDPFAGNQQKNDFNANLYFYFAKQVVELHKAKFEFVENESPGFNICIIFNQI
ncbi:MAG TPA: response regulator [Bacteroidales bacterium]